MGTGSVDFSRKSHYEFQRGFPVDDTAQQAYDDTDLNRAIEAYRFFYPTVSGAAIVRGNEQIGVVSPALRGRLKLGIQPSGGHVTVAHAPMPALGCGQAITESRPPPCTCWLRVGMDQHRV